MWDSRDIQEKHIKDALKKRRIINGEIPITGRSIHTYKQLLFPERRSEQSLVADVSEKNLLDVACGINPIYEESLLYKLRGSSKKDCLDTYSPSQLPDEINKPLTYYQTSAATTGFKDNTYELITVNNYMYLWERDPRKLQDLYKEFYRILKSNCKAEVRVFPVFYADYSQGDKDLFSFLQTHFKIRCLQPPTYSSEPPVFLEENKLQVAEKGCGTTEAKIYKELESHVVIFEKV